MTSKLSRAPSRIASARLSPSALISTAGRRRVLAPWASSRRHSGIAGNSGLVTSTPTPARGDVMGNAYAQFRRLRFDDPQIRLARGHGEYSSRLLARAQSL